MQSSSGGRNNKREPDRRDSHSPAPSAKELEKPSGPPPSHLKPADKDKVQPHVIRGRLLHAPISASLAGSGIQEAVLKGRGRLPVRAPTVVPSKAGGGGGTTTPGKAKPSSGATAPTPAAKPPVYLAKRPWEATATVSSKAGLAGRVKAAAAAMGLDAPPKAALKAARALVKSA